MDSSKQTQNTKPIFWQTILLTIGLILIFTFVYNWFSRFQQEPHTWEADPILVYYQEEPGWSSSENIWSVTPELVIYNTGQVFQFNRDGINIREVREGYLSHRKLCNFLYEIEKTGFLEVGPGGYSYPSNITVYDGSYTLVWIHAWKQQYMLAHVLGFVISEGYAAPGVADFYKMIGNFELADSKPYIPQKIEMKIEIIPGQTEGILWPFSEKSLTEIYSSGEMKYSRATKIIEGELAQKLFQFSKNRVRMVFFEDDIWYTVYLRPLLPYEDWEAAKNHWFGMSIASDAPKVRMSCP